MSKMEGTIELFKKYVVGNYTRHPVVLVRGEGSYVWDIEGKRYLDLFPGWGVNILGHCHPKVVEAISYQASELIHIANNFYNELQVEFARLLSERSWVDKWFFCNSGAEANEGAIKLARRHSPKGKFKIITMGNSFHGRTLTTITATAQKKYHEGFEPLTPGFRYVPFNDAEAVVKAVDEETCAIMVEPIQGEGGVNVPAEHYLTSLREICDRHGLLLILDEVQTGVGRLGEWFGHILYKVKPDIVTLAKGLGGGMAIGAMGARAEVAESLVPGSHASTFGGNPLACSAGIATIKVIEEEGLLDNAVAIGKYLKEKLQELSDRCGVIREIRGRGLMIGAELSIQGAEIEERCLEEGLLINCTHQNILRFLPALNVGKAEIDEGIDILGKVLGV